MPAEADLVHDLSAINREADLIEKFLIERLLQHTDRVFQEHGSVNRRIEHTEDFQLVGILRSFAPSETTDNHVGRGSLEAQIHGARPGIVVLSGLLPIEGGKEVFFPLVAAKANTGAAALKCEAHTRLLHHEAEPKLTAIIQQLVFC